MTTPREITLARSRLRTIKRYAETLLEKLPVDAEVNPSGATDVVEDLMRRAEHNAADGYPPRSMGDGTGGGSGDSTPTEARALRLASPAVEDGEEGEPDTWEERQLDQVSELLREFAMNLGRIDDHLARNDKIRRAVLSVETRMKKRQTDLSDCECCSRSVLKTREDPMRSGYCTECFDAWVAAGRPERIEFNRTRVVCAECERSTDDWEVLDKRNHHRRGTGPGCFWKAYNRSRGRRDSRGA